MEKWSIEKANEWYKKLPWIRGFCYYPSLACNRIEMWQEYNWDNMRSCIEQELKLAHEWGFNAVRLIGQLEVYIDQHDSYMSHIEQVIEIANQNEIKVMFCFGNDCVVTKENYSWPKYGEIPFDFGYHSGRKKSPHVVMNEPGYNLIDEEKYEKIFYQMIDEIVEKYKEDERVLVWDIYNEVGNSRRGMMSINYLINAFERARSHNPIQPCAACCWSYNENNEPYKEIELKALELSDIILYHCYLPYEASLEVIKYLKRYNRPMMNTEWLHRIWHNNIEQLFPLFYEENIGCFNWGFVTGKSQTREPWEWLFNAYDKGKGRDWDFSKWQHDLVRPNLRPYDFKEYEIIKEITLKADNDFKNRNK